jgi:hypothetical protein
VNILVSHAKDVSGEALALLLRQITDLLNEEANGAPFTLKLARDEWNENFERCGGWGEWIQSICSTDWATGKRRYDAIVQNGTALGRASAQILRLAITSRIPVVVLADGQLVPCTGISDLPEGERSWKHHAEALLW